MDPPERPPLERKAQERDYKQHFRRHILPRLGEITLSDQTLTTRALTDFQNYLLHEAPRRKKGLQGLAVKTVKNIIDGSFRAMVRDAREIDQLMTTDPFKAIQ